MIASFRHRGLKALYAGRTSRRVAPAHVARLRDILAALDHSRGPEGMNLPGFRLHELKGAREGHYAVSVSGNRRVTFRFKDGMAVDVDYVDYH
ncbi:MAG: type II toxin-antitoxin system RelE/ParE family toxin [Bryobacterales bacterium]|nr:type II toxin-antitoxin system RelE/ParE family toxin [Bryobacterales bacterium]